MIHRPALIPPSISNTLITILIIFIPTLILSFIITTYFTISDMIVVFAMMSIFMIIQLIFLYFSKSIIMSMLRAKKIDQGWIYEHVKSISKVANIPTPEVYIIPDPRPNAFAVGILKSNSAIGINSGLIDILNERELRGVIAHEVAHIKNRDTLILTTASMLFNLLGISLEFVGRSMLMNNNNRNAVLGFGIILASFIFRLIVSPILLFALSRNREYIADETGARLISDPLSLADALEKIDNFYKIDISKYTESRPEPIARALNMMYIQPVQKSNILLELFSTHPPTYKRIERLKELAREMGIY